MEHVPQLNERERAQLDNEEIDWEDEISPEQIAEARDYIKNFFIKQFLKHGKSADDPRVDDLTQQTMVAALKSRENFLGLDSYTVWLKGVARNILSMEFSSQRGDIHAKVRRLEEKTGVSGSDEDDIREYYFSTDPILRRKLEEAVASMSAIHQAAFDYFVKDTDQAEIARTLNIPIDTVRTRQFYALKKLRAKLIEMGIDPQKINEE